MFGEPGADNDSGLLFARPAPVSLDADVPGFSLKQLRPDPKHLKGGRNIFMSKKLFVGNLAFSTTGQDLETLFAELNRRDVGGPQINVSEAKEREPRSGGGGRSDGGGGRSDGGFGRRSY